MNKSILIIDTPKSCYKCPMMFDDGNGIWCGVERDKDGDMHMRVHYYCDENGRASWCPLKPMPQKNKYDVEKYATVDYENDITLGHYLNKGWNECIDEILGEEE